MAIAVRREPPALSALVQLRAHFFRTSFNKAPPMAKKQLIPPCSWVARENRRILGRNPQQAAGSNTSSASLLVLAMAIPTASCTCGISPSPRKGRVALSGRAWEGVGRLPQRNPRAPGLPAHPYRPLLRCEGRTAARRLGSGGARTAFARAGGNAVSQLTPGRASTPPAMFGQSVAVSMAAKKTDEEFSLRILLVEDDPEMAMALRCTLQRDDMIVDLAPRLRCAEASLAMACYDAVLLDRSLPDGDGLALLGPLRQAGRGTPVIVLTAKGDLADRIDGLDAGADDYMAKPFATEELLARLRAISRRPSDLSPSTVTAGRLVYDFRERVASIGGVPLVLPRRELLLLEALVRRLGRTVQRGVIEDAVYGFDDEVHSNSLDAHVSRLRRKLVEGDAGVEIHAIRGVGYLLKQA